MAELAQSSVRARVREALGAAEFDPVKGALQRLRTDDARMIGLVLGVNNSPVSQTPLLRLRDDVALAAGEAAGRVFPRYVLLVAAAQHLAGISALPVSHEVHGLFLEEFTHLASCTGTEQDWFEIGRPNFGAMCKLFTLRRFPAGQFHWEVSGLPRSNFLRVKGLDRARLVRGAWRLGGLSPLFVPHMPWRRPLVFLERQQLASYFRMADAMLRQPAVRGLLAEAWFHAPATAKVSPHLAWVNKVFHAWGGLVLNAGPAGEDSGVFVGSEARRRLAAEGRFTPQLGLVLWSRHDMLRWAEHYDGLQAAG